MSGERLRRTRECRNHISELRATIEAGTSTLDLDVGSFDRRPSDVSDLAHNIKRYRITPDVNEPVEKVFTLLNISIVTK